MCKTINIKCSLQLLPSIKIVALESKSKDLWSLPNFKKFLSNNCFPAHAYWPSFAWGLAISSRFPTSLGFSNNWHWQCRRVPKRCSHAHDIRSGSPWPIAGFGKASSSQRRFPFAAHSSNQFAIASFSFARSRRQLSHRRPRDWASPTHTPNTSPHRLYFIFRCTLLAADQRSFDWLIWEGRKNWKYIITSIRCFSSIFDLYYLYLNQIKSTSEI